MLNVIFGLFSLAHLAITLWAARLWLKQRAPAAGLIAIVTAGLIWDNGIVALGSTIGVGDTLHTLSFPRFCLHAILTPVMIWAAVVIGSEAGIRWLGSTAARTVTLLVTAASIAWGCYELFHLEIFPACTDGVVRYTTSVPVSQLCSPDQVPVRAGGPPIPAIISVLLVIGIGAWMGIRKRWPWMFVGGVVMFIGAALPSSQFGLAPGNLAEVVYSASLLATIAYLLRQREKVRGPTNA